MKDQDVREQLLALRKEVGALSDSLLNLRQDDSRRVAGSQLKLVLKEQTDRFFSKTMNEGGLGKDTLSVHKSELEELIDDFTTTYQVYGQEKASGVLDEFENGMSSRESADIDHEYFRFAYNMVHQMRNTLERSEEITNPVKPRVGSLLGLPRFSNRTSLSPTRVESILSPLANAWRINILLTLANEDCNLTEVSKALGLKKGHLQFHLTSLLESKYIRYDQKTHLYSIMPQGIVALDEMEKMVDRLSSIE